MEDQAACKYQSNDPDEQKQDAGSDLVHKTPFRPEDGPSYTGYFSDGNIIAQKCQTINKDIRKNIYRRITPQDNSGRARGPAGDDALRRQDLFYPAFLCQFTLILHGGDCLYGRL